MKKYEVRFMFFNGKVEFVEVEANNTTEAVLFAKGDRDGKTIEAFNINEIE